MTIPVGVPLGIGTPVYESIAIPIAPNSTLIAYTDGLIERRTKYSTPGWNGCARRPRWRARRLINFLHESLTPRLPIEFPMSTLPSWLFDGFTDQTPVGRAGSRHKKGGRRLKPKGGPTHSPRNRGAQARGQTV